MMKNNEDNQVLFELSYNLSGCMDRNYIANLIHPVITRFFHVDHCFLGLIDPFYEKFFIYSVQTGSSERKENIVIFEDVLIPHIIRQKLAVLKTPITISAVKDELLRDFFSEWTSKEYANGVIISICEGKKAIGFLGLGFEQLYKTIDFIFLDKIGKILFSVMSNILARENITRHEKESNFLLGFSKQIAAACDLISIKQIIDHALKNLLFIRAFLITINNDDDETYSHLLQFRSNYDERHIKLGTLADNKFPIKGKLAHTVLNSEEVVAIELNEINKLKNNSFSEYSFWRAIGAKTVLGSRLRVGNNNIGIIWLEPGQMNNRLLTGISAIIAMALSNEVFKESSKKLLKDIEKNNRPVNNGNNYYAESPESVCEQNDIIGNSPEIQKVCKLIERVAHTNSTVLLLGETGTGKELIAQAVHNNSPRKEKLMVRVNCAALPVTLIESELFGHEKGSFTGAHEQKIGKFERADNGCLFLDEIGELSLELQVKILRVLQEREIERIGGSRPIKINVRIIAATNRNLYNDVLEGRFRSDLYYRLNVFPINIPPLRDRKGDIPLLAMHFVKKFAKSTDKNVTTISIKALEELTNHDWPGNIRELEHLIERSLLLSRGNTIKTVHLSPDNNKKELTEGESLKTIEENEREHIIKVLDRCRGKIFGKGGAADMLGVPASTLNSKIKKLNIKKNSIFNNK